MFFHSRNLGVVQYSLSWGSEAGNDRQQCSLVRTKDEKLIISMQAMLQLPINILAYMQSCFFKVDRDSTKPHNCGRTKNESAPFPRVRRRIMNTQWVFFDYEKENALNFSDVYCRYYN